MSRSGRPPSRPFFDWRYRKTPCEAEGERGTSPKGRYERSSSGRFPDGSFLARAVILMLGVGAMLPMGSACVRRTVSFDTDPQGARVYLNDEPIGRTPVTADFTWYGDYDVIIRHEGYETLSTHERINAPWYQIPPLDFVAEALVPVTITDRRFLQYALEPKQYPDRAALIENAKDFRDRALFEP